MHPNLGEAGWIVALLVLFAGVGFWASRSRRRLKDGNAAPGPASPNRAPPAAE